MIRGSTAAFILASASTAAPAVAADVPPVVSASARETIDLCPTAAALVLLGHEPGMTIDQLHKAVSLSQPGGVRLIDRLAAVGLVERRRSETDGRAVALYLTKAGEQACTRILTARGDALSRGLAALGPEELTDLASMSEKMLRAVLREDEHAARICRLCDYVACADCPVDRELTSRGEHTAGQPPRRDFAPIPSVSRSRNGGGS